jgi:hypothetical protein
MLCSLKLNGEKDSSAGDSSIQDKQAPRFWCKQRGHLQVMKISADISIPYSDGHFSA